MDIKFRAWDIEAEHMDIIDDLYWFEESGVHKIEGGSAIGHFSEYKIMLSTELKDSKGKLIYEGDILQYNKDRLVVRWSDADAAFLCGWVRTDYATRLGEVIGNIYEHAHLLEDKP